jgi:hypothetical protein
MKFLFVCILKVTEERSRIRNGIRIRYPDVRIPNTAREKLKSVVLVQKEWVFYQPSAGTNHSFNLLVVQIIISEPVFRIQTGFQCGSGSSVSPPCGSGIRHCHHIELNTQILNFFTLFTLQCSGSNFVSLWALWIRIRYYLHGSGWFHQQAKQ